MDASALKNRKLFEQAIAVTLMALLAGVCFLVLKPFVSAMLWSAILVFASWPMFKAIRAHVTKGHAVGAAVIMTVLATLLLIIPLWILLVSSLDMAAWAMERLQAFKESGIPKLVAAMNEHPFFSRYADEVRQWLGDFFNDTNRVAQWSANASRVTLQWLLQRGMSLGYGAFQVCTSLLFMFLFYIYGKSISDSAGRLFERVGGPFMARLQNRMAMTLNVVVRGAIGTALVQALAAAVGFAIFDVSNILLFTSITFVLGLLPFGPAVLWIPLGLWLLAVGRVGDGIGMLVYGGVVISSVDNIARPILIAGSMDFSILRRRRHPLVFGALNGLIVAIAFMVFGLPWWIGVLVWLIIGFSAFRTAGAVALLAGAIWLFARGQVINGVWLLLCAAGLLLLLPVLMSLIHRFVPEPVDAGAAPEAAATDVSGNMPFALMLVGVMGGMMAFGFIGMFLGPVVLALGYDVVRELTQEAVESPVDLPETRSNP